MRFGAVPALLLSPLGTNGRDEFFGYAKLFERKVCPKAESAVTTLRMTHGMLNDQGKNRNFIL